MDKLQLLQEIKNLAAQNQISKDELTSAFDEAVHTSEDVTSHHVTISDVLYFIGGAIVFLGIAILISQNWGSLNAVTKILVTLGSAVAGYVIGFVLGQHPGANKVEVAFFMISALLMPLGVVVTLDQTGFDAYTPISQSFVAGLVLAVYLLSYFAFKKNMFLVFSVLFGTWFYFVFTEYIFFTADAYSDSDFFFYRGLVAGFSYMMLAYQFSQDEKRPLSGFLYSFGVLGFLGSAMALQGFAPDANGFWEIIFPGLVFGIMFLSVYLKRTSLLVFGAIFLMGYILKLTGEYFSDGLGWSASLVIAGLALIAIGYYTVLIKKKYIST